METRLFEHCRKHVLRLLRLYNDCSHRPRHVSSLIPTGMADLNQSDMAKHFQTPFATHCTHDFFIENYGFELFNLSGTVGKVELNPTCTSAVCECWNVSD